MGADEFLHSWYPQHTLCPDVGVMGNTLEVAAPHGEGQWFLELSSVLWIVLHSRLQP